MRHPLQNLYAKLRGRLRAYVRLLLDGVPGLARIIVRIQNLLTRIEEMATC